MSPALTLCGLFYALLCVFSIVTGLIYVSGKRKLNPLELSDRFMARLSDPEKLRRFTVKMGWVTFAVGIVQGFTAYAFSGEAGDSATASPWASPFSPSPPWPSN